MAALKAVSGLNPFFHVRMSSMRVRGNIFDVCGLAKGWDIDQVSMLLRYLAEEATEHIMLPSFG